MPLQQAPTLDRERTEVSGGGSPLLGFIAVLAALVAIIALVVALSGDGSGSDVNIDQPVPADTR
jgi:hypothetical protein